MLDDLYSIYLPKKTHPWCYISLEIDPNNVDVNVHPTKSQVKFLHEEAIVERVKGALDEKLSCNSASRTFYAQARLPQVDVTKEALTEVLPEFTSSTPSTLSTTTISNVNKNKIQAKQMIRTDHQEQKLEKFRFTINSQKNNSNNLLTDIYNEDIELNKVNYNNDNETLTETQSSSIIELFTDENSFKETTTTNDDNHNNDDDDESAIISEPADRALKKVQLLFGESQEPCNSQNNNIKINNLKEFDGNDKEKVDYQQQQLEFNPLFSDIIEELTTNSNNIKESISINNDDNTDDNDDKKCLIEEKNNLPFKSYSINSFRRKVELTSVLKLRKNIEDNYHRGLRKILSEMIFIGCIDENLVLFQSDVNLYICKTKHLINELFYEIMLYDFANYGVLKFSSSLSLIELAKIGLDNPESGWSKKSETDKESKEAVAEKISNLLISKADMLKEYFSIVITKNGLIRSLPVLLEDYCPYVAGELPMYICRLATQVDWTNEQKCFDGICRETAKFYSNINYYEKQENANSDNNNWKYLIEHILFPAIKSSLLPPKEFAHDSSILQIASLPNLYKVFERC